MYRLLLILFGIFFFLSYPAVAETINSKTNKDLQLSKQENLRKHNLYKNIRYYYLQSLIPSIRFVPPIHINTMIYDNYVSFFKEKYPHLNPSLEKSSTYKLYDISKYITKPLVFVGLPPYLERVSWKANQRKSFDINIDVNEIIKNNGLSQHLTYTKENNEADIFIIPIEAYSPLRVLNPNVIRRPFFNKDKKYATVLKDITDTFFNVEMMKLNNNGLHGAIIKDNSGRIIASFCPVDISSKQEELEKDIYYCLVQSIGLPSFYKTFPDYNEKTIHWAKLLMAIHSCKELKPKQNFFQDFFTKSLFDTCLNQ